jgi:hypothetical protein
MPRSRSTPIQTERTRRRSPRLDSPASWIVPPNSSNFSVKLISPASGATCAGAQSRWSRSPSIHRLYCRRFWPLPEAVRCSATSGGIIGAWLVGNNLGSGRSLCRLIFRRSILRQSSLAIALHKQRHKFGRIIPSHTRDKSSNSGPRIELEQPHDSAPRFLDPPQMGTRDDPNPKCGSVTGVFTRTSLRPFCCLLVMACSQMCKSKPAFVKKS